MELKNVKLDEIKLIEHRVLIKPDPIKQFSENGILIPETMQQLPLIGTVIKVGKGSKVDFMRYKEGDRVIYPRAVRDSKWIIEGETYLFCIQQNIIAKIN